MGPGSLDLGSAELAPQPGRDHDVTGDAFGGANRRDAQGWPVSNRTGATAAAFRAHQWAFAWLGPGPVRRPRRQYLGRHWGRVRRIAAAPRANVGCPGWLARVCGAFLLSGGGRFGMDRERGGRALPLYRLGVGQ